MQPREIEGQIAGLAVLDEPVRRSLYFYVVSRQADVGRDEAARAVGVSRTLAGFHLDKLADEGLLETSFKRLSGRTGPGAGRPAKLYRRSGRELSVSLPQRSYALAATILAGAIEGSASPEIQDALRRTARRVGEHIGKDAKLHAGLRAGRKRLLDSTVAALEEHGYEPRRARGEVRLHNCPFHALVDEHKELVCSMNLALIEGVVDGLDVPGTTPVLDPQPGLCCVCLRLAPPAPK